MLEKALDLTREYDMLPTGATVLCAVSGGADSMCLLHWLSQREGIALHAAHFDHRLRGEESALDAEFVRAACEDWGIPFHLGGGDVAQYAEAHGLTTEEGARQLRYAFLREKARQVGATVIATAHTADDNAETLLLNLVRGTGLKGLAGIPPLRKTPAGVRVVRPLLTTAREDVLAYLEEHHIPHREDSSNADESYTRNRLRRRVMPVLRELNPQAVSHMGNAAGVLRALDGWLEEETAARLAEARVEEGAVAFPMRTLRDAPEPLRPRLVQGLLDALGVGKKDFGSVHLGAILDLKPGGHLDLPSGVGADLRKGILTLTTRDPHYNPRKIKGE